MIISFDVDGVIAASTPADFNPNRTAAEYFSKPAHHMLDLTILNRLIAQHHTYFISARSFPNALKITRTWLKRAGVNVCESYGVLCAEGTRGQEHVGSQRKHEIIQWLGCDLHIDDHSMVIPPLGDKGILYYNPAYPENVQAYYHPTTNYYTATTWQQIEEIVNQKEKLCRTNN